MWGLTYSSLQAFRLHFRQVYPSAGLHLIDGQVYNETLVCMIIGHGHFETLCRIFVHGSPGSQL